MLHIRCHKLIYRKGMSICKKIDISKEKCFCYLQIQTLTPTSNQAFTGRNPVGRNSCKNTKRCEYQSQHLNIHH